MLGVVGSVIGLSWLAATVLLAPWLLSPPPRRPRPSGARSCPRRLARRGRRRGLADHDRGREPLMATREHDNDQPASPWSRTSVQLSTLFVLMLLVVGIAIAIFHHGSQHARAGNAPATCAGRRPARHHNDLGCRRRPVLACGRGPAGALRELPARGYVAGRWIDERAAVRPRSARSASRTASTSASRITRAARFSPR